MYGVALGLAGSEPKNVYERVAVGLLRKLSSSPASIFVPGQGYLQALDNKLTYSKDFTNAVWTKFGTSTTSSANTINLPADLDRVFDAVTVTGATAYTAAWLLSGSGTVKVGVLNGSDNLITVTLTSTPTYYVLPFTSAGTSINVYAARRDSTTATSVTVDGVGLFPDTYTAQQVAALGIPWTMATASVSLSLGPELIANGDFSNGTTSWGVDSGATLAATNGELQVSAPAAAAYPGANQSVTLSNGSNYWVSVKGRRGTTTDSIGVNLNNTSLNTTFNSTTTDVTYSASATASASGASPLKLFCASASSAAGTAFFDNISVKQILSVACPVYTDAHVYLPGSTVTSYGPEILNAPALIGSLDAGWTFDQGTTTFTYSGAAGYGVPTAAWPKQLNIATAITPGKTYTWTFDITCVGSGGGVGVGVAPAVAGFRTTGTYTMTMVATDANAIAVQNGNSTSLSIRIRSIREVITTSSVTSGLTAGNYTSNDGSTGYSAIDGTAGLVLDAAGAVGAEIFNQGTLDFTAGGWTKSGSATAPSANVINLPTAGSSEVMFAVAGQNSANKSYLVTLGINGTGTVSFGVTNNVDSASRTQVTLSGSAQTVQTIVKMNGTTATGAGVSIQRGASDTCTTATITSVSWKEVTGIHASQSTTANKPALRRGLYNLLTYSRTLSNAAWGKTDVTPVQNQTGADGTANAAWTCTEGSAGTAVLAIFPTMGATGAKETGYFLAKYNGTRWLWVIVGDSAADGCNAWFDLQNGVVGSVTARGVGSGYSLSMTPTSNGFYLCAVTCTPNGTYTQGQLSFHTASADASQVRVSGGSYILDASGVSLGQLTSAQILAEGGIPTTTSAAASNPSAGRYSWDFQTAGKGLVLGSPVAQMTDDSWCVVCVNAVSNATDKYIANLGCGAVNQLISSVCIKSTGFAQAAWVDDGAAHTKTVVDAVNHHGIPTVVSAVKRGGVGYLRVNGVQIGSVDLTVMGATTVTAGMIGGFNAANTSNQFVGSMGQPNMGKGTISDADLLTIERQCAANFPAGPVF